ncbi:NAD+ synthase [Candidatus Micrarchaeota archaeon]|nr:NAD+ synthase [Candidatus Micrarchaeota archaeon]
MREYMVLEKFIKRKVREAGARGVVVGLSGGIDSAVVATLCTKALGKRRVTALIMPERETTGKREIEDALRVAKHLGVEYYTIDFSSVYTEFKRILPTFEEGARIPNGNLRARIRMCILYYFSNSRNLLVAGTGNRSELKMGYFTRYGDGGVDFLPIGGLYKTEVRKLAEELGVPKEIIKKKPSPGLWEGQTAEGELGVSYGKLDHILMRVSKETDRTIARELGLKESTIRRVRERIKLMKFKCEMPEIA